jgi:hypothetical protein
VATAREMQWQPQRNPPVLFEVVGPSVPVRWGWGEMEQRCRGPGAMKHEEWQEEQWDQHITTRLVQEHGAPGAGIWSYHCRSWSSSSRCCYGELERPLVLEDHQTCYECWAWQLHTSSAPVFFLTFSTLLGYVLHHQGISGNSTINSSLEPWSRRDS